MQQSNNNPAANAMPAGISDEAFLAAVSASGYPLQTRVATELSAEGFAVQEEWSYLDGDTLRALDCRADYQLDDWVGDAHVYPSFNLFIECKRSDLPFVFFEAATLHAEWDSVIPFAGLANDVVSVEGMDVTPGECLSLKTLPFAGGPEAWCSTLSKMHRTGAKLELSGSEIYNGIVIPLIKAVDHAKRVAKPRASFRYFELGLIVPTCVVDAPMVVTSSGGNDLKGSLVPWVRLLRHEAVEGFDPEKPSAPDRVIGIEFVHFAFVHEWIESYVVPSAKEFAIRALKHHNVLSSGCGRIDENAADTSLSNLEPGLRDCSEQELEQWRNGNT
jgi:hypothetical protein